MIISVIVIHLKNTPAALPLLALAVADKAEVAHGTTLTEGLGTDEVGVRQRAKGKRGQVIFALSDRGSLYYLS